MEGFPRHRENSASIGPSRRLPKRPRTEISRDGSPAAGPSRVAGSGPALPAPADASTNTITVPGSVFLPARDSQNRRMVIDLTEDTPPRRQQEIIDVDALPDRPSSYFDRNVPADDYQLLMSRRRFPRPGAVAPPPARPVEPNLNPPYNSLPFASPRYHQEIANPILGHGARTVHELGGHRNMNAGGEGNIRQDILNHILGGFLGSPVHRGFDFAIQARGVVQMNDFNPPGQLDYRLGVNGIMGETPPVEDALARRREAEYKAPPAAREGFTRSPTTDDVLVCPTCDHELGTPSEDSECQATVWLGKCGHVYCGKCAATFKAIPTRAKKIRGSHNGYCDVEGCKANLRGKGLWEIFL